MRYTYEAEARGDTRHGQPDNKGVTEGCVERQVIFFLSANLSCINKIVSVASISFEMAIL